MLLAVLLATVSIVFPREGTSFASLQRLYAIGSTDGGETNLVISGRSVPVYRTGAWATSFEVRPGTNVLSVGDATRTFTVAAPPAPSTNAAPARKYEKLPYAADVPKALPTNRPPCEITIVIDAGHGGSDSGALSPHGRCEKDANLALAKEVRDSLAARGYRVVMTREDDSFPALYDRPKVAHAANADAFVSIHHNAPPYDRDPSVLRYHTVYCWNDIGERLARAVNMRMDEAFGMTLKNNGVQRANYAVTRNPEIPSCLVEVDFITSPAGEEAVWNPVRRRLTAAAIADGIADWSNPK